MNPYLAKQASVAKYTKKAESHFNKIDSEGIWEDYAICVEKSTTYENGQQDCYIDLKFKLDEWENNVIKEVIKSKR